jgi:hypothetical protein
MSNQHIEGKEKKNGLTNISPDFIQKNFPSLESLGHPTIRDKTNSLIASSNSLQVNHFNKFCILASVETP